MSLPSQRRTFLKSFLATLATYILRPHRAFAQVIPFAFWQRVYSNHLWVWGVNTYGQLGNGTHTSYSSPVQLTGSWVQVNSAWTDDTTSATAVAFSVGIKADGTLWAWGDNVWGELGQNTHTGLFSSPVQIAGSWIQATCGGQGWNNPFGLAIRSDRTLWAWGDGSAGTLGQNSTTSYSSPVQVLGGKSWAMISGGYGQWMGIQINGTLWACGAQGAGELGLGTASTQYNSPTQVGGSWVQAVVMCDTSAGGCAGGIKADGSLWTWGGNSNGDLGVGNTTSYSSPVLVSSASWLQLSMSSGSAWGSHGMAIRVDGTLWGWGTNFGGQLGIGDTTNRSSPVQVPGSWRSVFAMQTGSSGCTLAIRSDGTLWAWGDNSTGLYGIGNSTGFYSSPVQVGSSTWSYIGGGQNTVMALK